MDEGFIIEKVIVLCSSVCPVSSYRDVFSDGVLQGKCILRRCNSMSVHWGTLKRGRAAMMYLDFSSYIHGCGKLLHFLCVLNCEITVQINNTLKTGLI